MNDARGDVEDAAAPIRSVKHVTTVDARDIDRVTFDREFYQPERPVLIRNASCWGDEHRPSFRWLESLALPIRNLPTSSWSERSFETGVPEGWTIADYVRALRSDELPSCEFLGGGFPYLMAIPLRPGPGPLGELARAFRAPSFLEDNMLDSAVGRALSAALKHDLFGLELFIGGNDAPRWAHLHVDSLRVDVLTSGIEGAKQFLLFPPWTPTSLISPSPEPCPKTGILRGSDFRVDAAARTPRPGPQFERAIAEYAYRGEITPDTILYTPPLWWHAAHNVGGPTVTTTWRSLRGAARIVRSARALKRVAVWRILGRGQREVIDEYRYP
jgi:hypothetical protein